MQDLPSNVVGLPLDPAEIGRGRKILNVLRAQGGDVDAMVKFLKIPSETDNAAIFRLECEIEEQGLTDEYRQLVKLHMVSRLRLLQLDALERLERIETYGVDTSALRPNEVMGFAKTVLGDLLAGQIHAAKKNTGEPSMLGGDDEDDDELERIKKRDAL